MDSLFISKTHSLPVPTGQDVAPALWTSTLALQ